MDQLSEDHDSDNGDVPSFTSALITSPAKPSMPAHMTAASPLVEQPDEPNEWRVRAGDDVPSFLYANGPGRIVRYNFNTVDAFEHPTFVSRHLVDACACKQWRAARAPPAYALIALPSSATISTSVSGASRKPSAACRSTELGLPKTSTACSLR